MLKKHFRRLAEEKPDLILMKHVMPGQNGFQLTVPSASDPLCMPMCPSSVCTSKNQETGQYSGACAKVAQLHHQSRSIRLSCSPSRTGLN